MLDDSGVTAACRAALVAAEDVRFYRHVGIDVRSLATALRRNLAQRRIVWGGSTLTQQLVKNLFRSRDKTPLRKLREMLGALLLDRIVSKRGQITWYLNVAELAPGVIGLEAAAQHCFGRPARDLRLAPCVALFALLPDPIRSHRALADGRGDPLLAARREGILRALERARALPAAEIAAARADLAAGPAPVSSPRAR
jgi:membrane peptidoglycan carboxypeptidase